jgi:hypothetical protein
VIVDGSLNRDGVYFVIAKNRHEACCICQRENEIKNSQSGTTYTAIKIGETK